MNREAAYLLSLCRAYLEGKPLAADGSVDYDLLYTVANSHNLSAILFTVMNTSGGRELIPPETLQRFEEDFFEAFTRFQVQSQEIAALDTVLSENEIPHIFFKGVILRDLYPVPEARVMGDIDVLIRPELRDTVRTVLKENGYVCERSNGPVYNYRKNGALIEMHTKIISGRVGKADTEAFFADAAQHATYNGFTGTLDTEYHFAYLIAHIAHHFRFYGAGVKLLLDLAVMQKAYPLDTEKVFALLDGAGLADFARVILTLCYEWFGVGCDYGANTEKTKQFLLSYGAFGNVNRNNAAVIERRELEEGKARSSFSTKLHLLFPSYETLRGIDYIRFIDGRPYLTPAAWIYRIYYNFRYKRRFVRSSVKAIGSDETNSEAQEELAYFKEIGLI